PTGRFFHRYVNPERSMPSDAMAVHGLSDEFLATHARFAEVVEEFLDFIGTAPLVIHNAAFDIGFLNAELARLDRPALGLAVADTLALARKRYPGAPASLDALCKRFNIDNSERTMHGARIDCELLAAVYLELIGGRQPGFELAAAGIATGADLTRERRQRPPRSFPPTAAEFERHRVFLEKLKSPIWLGE
ncbi:MAG: DNA polymerase III subunit epsilon, partial [Stellaceae bacterium]